MPMPSIKNYFSTRLAWIIRTRHTNAVVKLGAQFCDWYLFQFWNQQNWDVNHNGESLALRTLAQCLDNGARASVFDVGANTGEYTRLARSILPESTIHCFEVVPDTRATLEREIHGLQNVIVSEYGLSNDDSPLTIGSTRPNDTQSRVLSPLSENVQNVVECNVTTGDQYLAENRIDTIDLLKIDTEGHDMAVLEGFRGAFSESRVRMVQFEYGSTWIAPRRLLCEAYLLLEPMGFRIGRLFPDGVIFKPYDRVKDDHFRMGNYVAVKHDDRDLIERLSLV